MLQMRARQVAPKPIRYVDILEYSALMDAAMIKFGLHRPQTGFDVPKALSICYLSKSHAEVLVVAGKSFYPIVAAVSANTFVEFAFWQKVYQL